MTTASVVIIGDEILSGKFNEENAAYLVGELRELGVALRRIVTIPDTLDDIAEVVALCSARYGWVFTSGGIGPTHDDVTIAGIARAFGVPIVRHPELERLLRGFYGQSLEPRNLRMASVPEGAALLAADHPSWPVTTFRNVVILPGVPVIFRRKFTAIRERFRSRPYFLRRIYCRAEEGALASHLDAVVAQCPLVQIGSYPRVGERDYQVLVTLESREPKLLDEAQDLLVARLPPGVVVSAE